MHTHLVENSVELKLKQLKLKVVIFFMLCATLKVSLAQILWTPRSFSLNDLIEVGSASNDNIIMAQVLTVLGLMSGCFAFYIVARQNFRSDRRYAILSLVWILFVTVDLVSSFTNNQQQSPEKLLPIFVPFIAKISFIYRETILKSLFIMLGTVIYMGFYFAITNPEWAFILDYESELALFKWRYSGVLSHPNQVGALAAIVIMLAITQSKNMLFWAIVAGAALTLILAQSKTSIICAIMSLCVFFLHKRKSFDALTKIMLSLCVVFFLMGWFIHMSLISTLQDSELISLTGRAQIWIESISLWKENFIIGAGPEVYSLDFRVLTGLTGAASAHNQFLQSASTTGLVGVILLCALSFYIVLYAWPSAREQYKYSAVISCVAIFIFLKGFSEPSLSQDGFSVNFFVMLLFFILCCKDKKRHPIKNA